MVYTYEFMDVCFILAMMLLSAVELEEVVSWSGPLQVASPHQGPHHQLQSDAHCPDAGNTFYDFGTMCSSTTKAVEVLLVSVHIV